MLFFSDDNAGHIRSGRHLDLAQQAVDDLPDQRDADGQLGDLAFNEHYRHVCHLTQGLVRAGMVILDVRAHIHIPDPQEI